MNSWWMMKSTSSTAMVCENVPIRLVATAMPLLSAVANSNGTLPTCSANSAKARAFLAILATSSGDRSSSSSPPPLTAPSAAFMACFLTKEAMSRSTLSPTATAPPLNGFAFSDSGLLEKRNPCARVCATMSKAARCARQCQKSVILALLQGILIVAFLLFAFYVASILLEPAPILGITTVPPGLLFSSTDASGVPRWRSG